MGPWNLIYAAKVALFLGTAGGCNLSFFSVPTELHLKIVYTKRHDRLLSGHVGLSWSSESLFEQTRPANFPHQQLLIDLSMWDMNTASHGCKYFLTFCFCSNRQRTDGSGQTHNSNTEAVRVWGLNDISPWHPCGVPPLWTEADLVL